MDRRLRKTSLSSIRSVVAVLPHRRAERRGPLLLLILSLTALAACGPTGPAGRGGESELVINQPASAGSWSRLANPENGLEVRQWVIDDEPDRIASAMRAFHRPDERLLDEQLERRLRRNGFRVARVPIDSLEELSDALGGPTLNVESWLGQMTEWRELHHRQVRQDRRAVSVDGRIRMFSPGKLQLMLRSWLMPMEDGPTIMVHLMPRHREPQQIDFRQLLGRSGDPGRSFDSMAIEMQLAPDYAFVLTAAPPDESWDEDATGDPGGDQDESREGDAPSRGPTGRTARGSGVGPPVQTPVTVGELLLIGGRGAPSRGVLVFVPRIGSELRLPEELDSDDLARKRSPRREGEPSS